MKGLQSFWKLENILCKTNERSYGAIYFEKYNEQYKWKVWWAFEMKGHTEQYSLCPRMLLHIKVQIEQYKLKI